MSLQKVVLTKALFWCRTQKIFQLHFFKFQEGNIAQHIRDAIRKEKLQREYKHHNVPVDLSSRARRQHKLAARQSRYQVVAHKRALQLEGLDAAEAQNRHNERQAAINALQHQPPHPANEQLSANKRKDVSDDDREAKKLFCLYDVVSDSGANDDQVHTDGLFTLPVI